tara:strand:- start:789 stop:1694 length:906 start_codon:yes stop_codon:yes gene_type:complete
MKRTKNYLLPLVLMFACFADADSSFYAKLNMSFIDVDKGSRKETDTISNASRIGFKSKIKISNDLNFLIQIENEFDPADGKADIGKVFKQRNTYIGLSGNFGRIFMGTHDTAFKQSQLKVDLFNDTQSDIKKLFVGENRMQDLIGYTSPEIFNGLKLTINNIKTSEKSYQSYSFNYKNKKISTSLGIDTGTEGFKGKRFTALIPLQKTTIGLMYQTSEEDKIYRSLSGHVFSIKHQLTKKGSLMIQDAKSDMKVINAKQTSIGYSYDINSILKVYSTLSRFKNKLQSDDEKIISIGFEVKL